MLIISVLRDCDQANENLFLLFLTFSCLLHIHCHPLQPVLTVTRCPRWLAGPCGVSRFAGRARALHEILTRHTSPPGMQPRKPAELYSLLSSSLCHYYTVWLYYMDHTDSILEISPAVHCIQSIFSDIWKHKSKWPSTYKKKNSTNQQRSVKQEFI